LEALLRLSAATRALLTPFFPPLIERFTTGLAEDARASQNGYAGGTIHKIIHRVAERGATKLWKAAECIRLLFAFTLYSPEAGILWKFRSILALTPA
jgi:hypothetical protein